MFGTENIDVLILCGGLGKRLKEVTGLAAPKPMIEFGGRPFLDLMIDYMAGFGFRRFILGVGYMAGVIESYFKINKKAELETIFSREDTPLDTGGAVKEAKRFIKSRSFFVLNGDCISEFNPLDFLEFHKKKCSKLSILLNKIADGREYGEVKIDQESRVVKFDEKSGRVGECLINSGVYIFNQEVFDMMPDSRRFSLERDLFPAMIGRDIFGCKTSSFFIDIGTPQRYAEAVRYLQSDAKNGQS